MGELTARDKGDIYREKRSYYLASAEMRGRGTANMFHMDTAGFVLEEQENVEAKPYFSLTGDEFADRPPTSSGQRAFALAVAEMKKTKDAFFDGGDKEQAASVPESVKEVLDRTISCFFAACGVDEEGNEVKDRQSMKTGREGFFETREAYAETVKIEKAKHLRKLITEFREEKGLAEVIQADQESEDPSFSALIEKHPKEAKEHREEIGRLREAILSAGKEAAERRAGREVLFSAVMKVYFDETVDWDYRTKLREAYLFSALETDEKIRELLYTREAANYQLKWLLCQEPVDEVIFEKIQKNFDGKPDVLDRKKRLSDLPGYTHPFVNLNYPVPTIDELDLLFQRADEISCYQNAHPEQFEAQSLLSVARLTNGFFDCIAKAASLVMGVDHISASDGFKSLDKESKIKLFFTWAMSDAVCRVGYTMIDFLLEYETRTMRKVSQVFQGILPLICFTRVQKQRKESLGLIMMERSGFHVSEQKDRFFEFYGL